MFCVVAVGCHSVLNNTISVYCFIHDHVNNTLVAIQHAQRRLANWRRKVRLGITELVRKVRSGITELVRKVRLGIIELVRKVRSGITELVRKVRLGITELVRKVRSGITELEP